MEKPARYKANKNNKKPASKPKTNKKKQNDGPTCSMFLSEITRKLASKKKKEEETCNIVGTIISSITNALPMKFSRKPSKQISPVHIESLQGLAPELLPKDALQITQDEEPPTVDDMPMSEMDGVQFCSSKGGYAMPRLPVADSEVFKQARPPVQMEDVAVNTSTDHDVASEIAKHVGTLRKISLIAEEFNQKTAKNLKEIVDSVQGDLMKKLEEAKAEEEAKIRSQSTVQQLQEDVMNAAEIK